MDQSSGSGDRRCLSLSLSQVDLGNVLKVKLKCRQFYTSGLLILWSKIPIFKLTKISAQTKHSSWCKMFSQFSLQLKHSLTHVFKLEISHDFSYKRHYIYTLYITHTPSFIAKIVNLSHNFSYKRHYIHILCATSFSHSSRP